MDLFDATEGILPFREGHGTGAILFDRERFGQVDAAWMRPEHWGQRARPVDSGGRGGAWFIDAPFGQSLLRQYKRGGMMRHFSHDRYLWHGAQYTRSFAEFRITRALLAQGLPVPRPIAASYLHEGLSYRAAILIDRLPDVRSFADRILTSGSDAPWEEAGRLIARFHRAGLDHADLNAFNILFDAGGRGWLIDFDRARFRIPAYWRERNLARLLRSCLKIRGARSEDEVRHDFARLRRAYERVWNKMT